jgi:PmbA protein
MTDLKAFKDKLFETAKAKGLAEFELYIESGKNFSVSPYEGQIEKFETTRSLGLCFRGKYKGKMGYAYSEQIADFVVDFLVDSVMENAEIVEDNDPIDIYGGCPEYPEVYSYNPGLDQVNAQQKIDMSIAMEQAGKDTHGKIKNLPEGEIGNFYKEINIANSMGLDVYSKSNGAYAYAMALAVDGDSTKSGSAFKGGISFEDVNPKEVGKKAAQNAVDMLGAEAMPSGKYPVIFNANTASEILEYFIEVFSADKAHKGLTMLAGKLGEQTAADIVNIIDDPLMPGQSATCPFDSEGVASRTKKVVDKGVFKTFLHSTKTAKKDGVQPTGNGFKEDFKSIVDIAATNFYIAAGGKTLDELVKEMGSGVLVTQVEGLHSASNVISGDFSVSASGFLVEDGKKSRPVEQITVSGNFFGMLKDVVGLGSDLRFNCYSNVSNAGSPSLWIKALDIAGE